MHIFHLLQKFRTYAGLPPLPVDTPRGVVIVDEATPATEDAEESEGEEAREEMPPTPGRHQHESSSSQAPPPPSTSPDAAAGKFFPLYFLARWKLWPSCCSSRHRSNLSSYRQETQPRRLQGRRKEGQEAKGPKRGSFDHQVAYLATFGCRAPDDCSTCRQREGACD